MKETRQQTKMWEELVLTAVIHHTLFQPQEDDSLLVVAWDASRHLADLHLPYGPSEGGNLLLPVETRYIIEKRVLEYLSEERSFNAMQLDLSTVPDSLITRMKTFTSSYESQHLSQEFFMEEVFYSFQGEGLDIGLMTAFVRVLGCDMKCVGCDTFYGEATPKTVKNTAHEMWSIERVINQIEEWKPQAVCFTGGEITLYYKKLVPLAAMLRAKGYWLTLQTNGKNLDGLVCGLIQSVNLDIKPPSSKQPVRTEKIKHLWPGQQVKVLVGTEEDLEFAFMVDEVIQQDQPDANLILQPYIFGHIHNAEGVVDGLKNLYNLMDKNAHRFKSNVRMTLQSHKLIKAR